MRINISLLVLMVFSLSGLLLMTLFADKSEIAYQQIQDNITSVLSEQKNDLQQFESQLSVYSNPFFIPEVSEISKRVYVNGTLVFWNDNGFIGEYNQIKRKDTLYTYRYEQGIKLVQRNEVFADRDLVEIFSFVTLYDNPQVKNQYLVEALNPNIFGDYKVAIGPTEEKTLEFNGREILSVTLKENSSFLREVYLLLFVLILFSSSLALIFQVPKIKHFKSLWYLMLLAALLVLGRTAIWYWTKDHITHWDLFRPINFTAEPIFYSLGDFILNLGILLVWLMLVYKRIYVGRNVEPSSGISLNKILGSILVTFLVCGLSYLSYGAIWMLLENSQIQLNISESIQFDSLRIGAYLIVMMCGIAVLVVFSMAIRHYNELKLPRLYHGLIIAVCYIGFSLVVGDEAWIYSGVFLLAWIATDFLGFSKRLRLFRYQTFVYLIILILSFAAVGSFSVYEHSEKDDRIAKEKFGIRLLIKKDILGELYLSEIIQEIKNDRYVRTRLMSRLLSRQNIREKVQRQFLSSYFKKYDINVFLFDKEGTSLQSETSSLNYEDWEAKYKQDSLETDYPEIYFVQDPGENVRSKYVCFLEINAYGRKVGYVILDLTLKKFIPTSVFPELLLESRYFLSTSQEFDYAIYKNNQVLYKQGRFSFENKLSADDLRKEEMYLKGMERDGVHYYGLKTQDGGQIIIISPTYNLDQLLANFSFIFLILLFAFGAALLSGQFLTDRSQFNLSTKIQLYLGLSFIIPLLIVSIALLNTLNRSYREEIDNNFQKRSYNLAENLIDATEEFIENRSNIDEYANEIAEAGALAQSDINIYDVRGRLITSSQPEIFRLGLISTLMDPYAFSELRYKQEQSLISDGSIGILDFKTSYTVLRAYDDGRLLAILAMPYFDSKNHLRRQQVEVFGSLITIFTIIFLISIFVGNVIVGNLIHPLKKIGEKLRTTSFEKENQPILYEANDEIGSLIKEYNLMVLKLEESKEALAVSQKESAWKEIARQVAHEIKNPLTPMRLKVQRMMESFKTDEKNYKTCLTLIDQVDTLSSIADSFSEFAKMPAPNNKSVDICTLLDSAIRLYQSDNVRFKKQFEKSVPEAWIDPKIFTGIFTNIILNAIQAADEDLVIQVEVKESNAKIMVLIADNGKGIPEEVQEKIFTPYFSTKSQGSGIGLAVAKKGIENAGGNIWFESEEGKGTSFYISLPVATNPPV